MYRLLLFGNVLLDTSFCIRENKDILARHGLKEDDLGECSMEKLIAILDDARKTGRFLSMQTGGSALNTATVLSNLKARDFIFCGSIGSDDIGGQVQKLLEQNGVNNCIQVVTTRPTGTCVCLISDDNRCCYANIGASVDIENDWLQKSGIWNSHPDDKQIFYIESFFITEDRFSICQYIFEELCSSQSKISAISIGAVYIINKYPDEIKYLTENASIIFGNHEEFSALANVFEQPSAENVMQYLANRACGKIEKIIVCTNGSKDVVFYHQQSNAVHVGRVPCKAIAKEQIADATGCGDAFVGGFFLAYLKQWNSTTMVEDCIKRGIEAAANQIRIIGGSNIPNKTI